MRTGRHRACERGHGIRPAISAKTARFPQNAGREWGGVAQPHRGRGVLGERLQPKRSVCPENYESRWGRGSSLRGILAVVRLRGEVRASPIWPGSLTVSSACTRSRGPAPSWGRWASARPTLHTQLGGWDLSQSRWHRGRRSESPRSSIHAAKEAPGTIVAEPAASRHTGVRHILQVVRWQENGSAHANPEIKRYTR